MSDPVIGGIMVGVSILSAGYSIYSSQAQANEAEEIAKRNADRIKQESEEQAFREKQGAEREAALMRARMAASRLEGETNDLYMSDFWETKNREINWIKKSGKSRASIAKDEGYATAGNIRAGGISSVFESAGTAASWWSTSGLSESFKNKGETSP